MKRKDRRTRRIYSQTKRKDVSHVSQYYYVCWFGLGYLFFSVVFLLYIHKGDPSQRHSTFPKTPVQLKKASSETLKMCYSVSEEDVAEILRNMDDDKNELFLE